MISGGCDSFGFVRFEGSLIARTEITRRKCQGDALRKQFDGCGIGADRALVAAGFAARARPICDGL